MRSLYAVRRPLVSDAPTQSLIGTLQHMQMLPILYTCSTNESITEFKCSTASFQFKFKLFRKNIYCNVLLLHNTIFLPEYIFVFQAPFKK